MLKIEVITSATEAGYFRAKSEEKRDAAFDSMVVSLGLDTVQASEAIEILHQETERRSLAYKARIAKSVQRAHTEAEKPLTGGMVSRDEHIETLPAGRYVITTAQNNTDVDADMLGALRAYCEREDARLLVCKTTYNKNGFQQAQDCQDGIYYAREIVPYLIDGHVRLGADLDLLANANVLPTAKNPLSGFQAATPNGVSIVVPAVKIALHCTAALNGAAGKILYSTGSVTLPNYIIRKAGAVALGEHNIGALFVDTTHVHGQAIVRQLEKMPGERGFYDEGNYYTRDGVILTDQPCEALQFGDIHAEKMTDSNLDKILTHIDRYRPRHAICHDVMDFSSRNHHNVKDCAFVYAQHIKGNTVRGDIVKVADVLDAIADEMGNGIVHIIESNHDLAINTWLKNSDFKADPINASVYLECMAALYKHIEQAGNTSFNMLEFAYSRIGGGVADNIVFHETDESVVLAGIECGVHGHTGINGSRGSPAQFRTLGIRLNTGHTHTPSIMGACYTAGVSGSLEMGYNVGPSSWRLANIVTWPNGQRQVIFM